MAACRLTNSGRWRLAVAGSTEQWSPLAFLQISFQATLGSKKASSKGVTLFSPKFCGLSRRTIYRSLGGTGFPSPCDLP